MDGLQFTVDVRYFGALAVIAPRGEVDLATVDAVRDALRAEEGRRRVVLDLRHVEFMDSSGLGLVVEEMRRAELDGFDFSVVSGPDRVQRLFGMVGLAERLVLLDDLSGVRDAQPDG
jgi:anti-sigma B factor antagonist